MKQLILLSLALIFSINLMAQKPNFTANLSSDTVNLEETFEIIFKVEGGKAQTFEQPFFSDFEVIYQNQSTQMSITNGKMTQSVSYTFGLKAKEEGSFAIEKASVEIDGTTYHTNFVKVVVDEDFVPKKRPQGNSKFWNPFGDFPNQDSQKPKESSKKTKKKRKIYKI